MGVGAERPHNGPPALPYRVQILACASPAPPLLMMTAAMRPAHTLAPFAKKMLKLHENWVGIRTMCRWIRSFRKFNQCFAHCLLAICSPSSPPPPLFQMCVEVQIKYLRPSLLSHGRRLEGRGRGWLDGACIVVCTCCLLPIAALNGRRPLAK